MDTVSPAKPAGREARGIARARCEQVLRQAELLRRRASSEALHDYRVALRRLRAWLRSLRDSLPAGLQDGPADRLRQLSRLAGVARDLEVLRDWLEGLRSPRRPAIDRLLHLLGRELQAARHLTASEAATRLPLACAEVLALLDQSSRRVDRSMGVAMAEAIGDARHGVARRLRAIHRLEQVREAHQARIAIKRLRYLLEALAPSSAAAARAAAQLGVLQQHFGELHDAQLVAERVAAESSGVRSLVLHRCVRLFRTVRRDCRAPETRTLLRRVAALARRLRHAGSSLASCAP